MFVTMFQCLDLFYNSAIVKKSKTNKNLATKFVELHLELTHTWKQMDSMSECISAKEDFRANWERYFLNKKLLDLYMQLKHVIIDKLLLNGTDNNDNMELVDQLKIVVEFEHSVGRCVASLHDDLNAQFKAKLKQIEIGIAVFFVLLAYVAMQ